MSAPVGYAIQETLKAVKLIEWAIAHEDSLEAIDLLDKRRWVEVCRLVEQHKLYELVSDKAWPYVMSNSPRVVIALMSHGAQPLSKGRIYDFERRDKVLELSWPDRPDIISFAAFCHPKDVRDARKHLKSASKAEYDRTYCWSYRMGAYLDKLLVGDRASENYMDLPVHGVDRSVFDEWRDDAQDEAFLTYFQRWYENEVRSAQVIFSESPSYALKRNAAEASEAVVRCYKAALEAAEARLEQIKLLYEDQARLLRGDIWGDAVYGLDQRMARALDLGEESLLETSAKSRYEARSFERVAQDRLAVANAKLDKAQTRLAKNEAKVKLEEAKGAFDRAVVRWRSRAAHWIMLSKSERLAKAQAYSADEFPPGTPLPCYRRDTVLGLVFGRMFGALCETRPFLAWVALLHTGTLRLTPFTRVYPAWAERCVAQAKIVEPEVDWDTIAADWRD